MPSIRDIIILRGSMMETLIGLIFIIATCFVLPIGGIIYISFKNKRALLVALVGAVTFFVSQGLLRIPLLQAIGQNATASIWMMDNVLLYTLLLCFSAGLFEETGRLISFKCLKKTNTLWEAIAFGLGHGGLEAILLVGIPALSQSGSLANFLLAGTERMAALLIHVTLSIIIYIGVQKRQALKYTLLAIGLHGIFNLVPTFILALGGTLLMSEGFLYMTTAVIFLCVYFFIIKRRIADEQIS